MLRLLLLACVLFWPTLGLAAPRTVAVLYFERGGEAPESLKVGLAQLLISDLVGTEGVKVVERTALQAILDELELGHSGVADPNTAAKVGRLLGAEWLVLGTYFELGGQIFVQSRAVRVETGEILAAHALSHPPAAFLTLQRELADAWRATLSTLAEGAPPVAPSTEPAPTRGAAPADDAGRIVAPDSKALEAAIAYSEGLIYLDGNDVVRAREAFEVAVAAEPALAEARAQLAALEL